MSDRWSAESWLVCRCFGRARILQPLEDIVELLHGLGTLLMQMMHKLERMRSAADGRPLKQGAVATTRAWMSSSNEAGVSARSSGRRSNGSKRVACTAGALPPARPRLVMLVVAATERELALLDGARHLLLWGRPGRGGARRPRGSRGSTA